MRSKDETEKSRASANPDTPLGIQMSAGRRPPLTGEIIVDARIQLKTRTIEVWEGREEEEEPGLLQFR